MLRLPPEVDERIRELADQWGITLAGVVGRLVEEHDERLASSGQGIPMTKVLPLEEVEADKAESPARLRDCLTELAKHTGAHVLRMELGVKPATLDGDGKSTSNWVMTVTHSLGVEHERKIGPLVAKAFFACLRGLVAKGGSVDVDEGTDSSGQTEGSK